VEVVHSASLLKTPSHVTADPRKLVVNSIFINSTIRPYVGKFKITPTYLGEVPKLLKTTLRPQVVLIKVSPPDARGFVSMGPGADVVTDLLADPRVKVIAEVNPNVPRTRGDSRLHISHIDRLVESNTPLAEYTFNTQDPVARAIGKNVAEQIPNGATLQLGIGELQENVGVEIITHGQALRQQGKPFKVGFWTEIGTTVIKDIAAAGLIRNGRDSIRLGFGLGSQEFYEFLSKDKRVKLSSTEVMNDPMIAGQQKKLAAVNSALAVDLYGQACSEMVPRKNAAGEVVPMPYSGVGGQVDFLRAAQRSPGGQGILTMRSTARNGTISAISLDLPRGVVVTTTRYDTDKVATEWGVAQLRGKDVIERAQALIRIAHPKFREELAKQGMDRFGGEPQSWTDAARVTPEELQQAAQFEAPVIANNE
jgi:4-hydroxybutyrate CoA-transferase